MSIHLNGRGGMSTVVTPSQTTLRCDLCSCAASIVSKTPGRTVRFCVECADQALTAAADAAGAAGGPNAQS